MAAKATIRTKAGSLKMYEKSFLLFNHTLFLDQAVGRDQLRILRDMLNFAYRKGVLDQQYTMRAALGLEE